MMVESEGSDYPNHPRTSLSPAPHAHLHPQVSMPLDIKHHIAHHTLPTTRHLKTIILKA